MAKANKLGALFNPHITIYATLPLQGVKKLHGDIRPSMNFLFEAQVFLDFSVLDLFKHISNKCMLSWQHTDPLCR